MNIDTKTAMIFILPILGVAVAWGESINRIETLEQAQKKLVTVNELETVKTKIHYIEQTTNENKTILLRIWGKLDQ
jgi:hypothetical protein